LENQEITMLALHLLQISLVYINTLMIQRILGEPNWTQRMTPEDLRALTPLIYTHVTPYGMFRLDMSKRLDIEWSGRLPDVLPGLTLPLVTRMLLQGLLRAQNQVREPPSDPGDLGPGE
jgi:Tn3 transposase DDE domain